MTLQRKSFLTKKPARWAMWGLVVSGATLLLFFAAYWVSLLLINYHPSFIPNAEKRMAMFRQARQHPRQGGFWIF